MKPLKFWTFSIHGIEGSHQVLVAATSMAEAARISGKSVSHFQPGLGMTSTVERGPSFADRVGVWVRAFPDDPAGPRDREFGYSSSYIADATLEGCRAVLREVLLRGIMAAGYGRPSIATKGA